MTSKLTVMDDLYEEVTCPVCCDVFINPHVLPCLHSLCLSCATSITENTILAADRCIKITCPTCRKCFSMLDLKSDFKTRRLLDIYQREKKRNLAIAPSTSVRNGSVADQSMSYYPSMCRLCDGCNQHTITFYCNNCEKLLCTSCMNIHTKLTKCSLNDCEDVEQTKAHCLSKLILETDLVEADMRKLEKLMKEKMDDILKQEERVLQVINTAEEDGEKHENEKHLLHEATYEYVQKITYDADLLIKKYMSLKSSLSNAKQLDTLSMITSLKPLLRKSNLEREILLSKQLSDPKIRIINDQFSHETALKIKVDEIIRNIIPVIFPSYQFLTYKPLTVQRTTSINDFVWTLLITRTEETLWCLFPDRVEIRNQDHSIVKTIREFEDGYDMVQVASGNVVVASTCTGLVEFNSTGVLLRCISPLSHTSVAMQDDRLLATRLQDDKVILDMFISEDRQMIKVCEIETQLSQYHRLTCAMIGETVYICSKENNTLLQMESGSGTIIMSKETYSVGGSTFKLVNPVICSCNGYHILVSCNGGPHGLLVFTPSQDRWSVVEWPLCRPITAAAGCNGQLHVACGGGGGPFTLNTLA